MNFGSDMYFFLPETLIKFLIIVSNIYNHVQCKGLKNDSDGNTVSETTAET